MILFIYKMSESYIDENGDVWNLSRKEYETDSQYNFRKDIYNNVYNDTHSKQKATLYSNFWVNILSMECQYSDEIMKQIEKYKPAKDIYNVKI